MCMFALHIYVFTCRIHIGIKLAAPLNAVHTLPHMQKLEIAHH